MKAKHQFRALQFIMTKPCKNYCSIKVWKQICIRIGLRQRILKSFFLNPISFEKGWLSKDPRNYSISTIVTTFRFPFFVLNAFSISLGNWHFLASFDGTHRRRYCKIKHAFILHTLQYLISKCDNVKFS